MAIRRAFRDMPKNSAQLDRLLRDLDLPNNEVTLAQLQDIASDRLIGRDSTGAGDMEALTVGGGIEFTGSGGIQRSALTGDVTASAGSNATTIPNDTVTYAKIQNVSSTDRLLGRSTAGAGDIEEIVCTAAGRALLDDASATAQRITLGLEDGTYTPTLTNVANLDSSTAYQCQYLRIGNTVVVSGRVDVDCTAAAATQLGISLPVATNFGAQEDCAGAAHAAVVAMGAAIRADDANDRALMEWLATDTINRAMFFTFAYQVI